MGEAEVLRAIAYPFGILLMLNDRAGGVDVRHVVGLRSVLIPRLMTWAERGKVLLLARNFLDQTLTNW